MTTFLAYTVELLIDPADDAPTHTADGMHVGFSDSGTQSLVFLAEPWMGSTYDPATHILISTHIQECGATYPVHLHTRDRDQIRYARDVLRDWFADLRNVDDMPLSVRDEILAHLADLDHYSARGSWQIELTRFGFPAQRFGAFDTPNDATTAITSGQAWALAGIDPATDPYRDDLTTRDMTVIPIPIGPQAGSR